MDIIHNGITSENNSTAIFTLSWYWSCAVWENVSQLFQACAENKIPAFTITKPWHDERKWDSVFSLSILEKETIEALQELRSKGYTNIILVGNSISSLPIIRAANAINWWVSRIVLISPVFDLSQTIRKKVKMLTWIDLPTFIGEDGVKKSTIASQIIPKIAQWVTLDQESFLDDVQKFWWIPAQQVIEMFPPGVPVDIYGNLADKIIWIWLMKKVSDWIWANFYETQPIPGDPLFHSVDYSKILEGVIPQAKIPQRLLAAE